MAETESFRIKIFRSKEEKHSLLLSEGMQLNFTCVLLKMSEDTITEISVKIREKKSWPG